MKKQKTVSLRRSLLASVMALALSCSMLIGTTFAWFTDSVASSNNIIKSGNLDIELEYLKADGQWATVGETTNVFAENALWEPGHTEVVYLKISNEGSLAFNYKLGVNIVEEVKSINVAGEELQLSTYIMMGAVADQATKYATRQEARDALTGTEVKAIKEGYAQTGVLYPVNNIPTGEASEEYLALVVYMPETVGNEANHKKGEAVPTIKLGINLLATQYTYEEDSFDKDYDKGANVDVPPVPVAPEEIDATVYDVFDANRQQENMKVTIDIYSFKANEYQEAYPVATYKDWTCDFFVSTDSPVEDGLALFGNYSTFGWLGFWVPAKSEAYEPTGLLGVVSSGGESNWTYEDICNDVQIFRCGLLDTEGKNTGVKVTVDLRMTSPDKTQTRTVSSITVTL